MERRAASHTEEEEMNQRRRLLGLARKGDPKAISKLFELYQVRVLNGDMLSKLNKSYYKAAAARFAKKDSAPQGQTQTVPTGIQQPAIDIPTDSGVGAPFTVDQLMAMPLKDLRALALQHSVVSSEMKPDEFKANLQGIATALANTLLQKAA